MLVRILSSIISFPILFFIVLFGGNILKLGIAFVSIIALYEFYNAIHKKNLPIHFLGYFISLLYIFTLKTNLINYLDIILILNIILLLINIVFNYKNINIFDIAVTLFGFFYITFMFSNIYLIRHFKYGLIIVWLPFISAWLCDTGAYFVGISIGKTKLTPELSPKKTIEGAIGGVVFSVIGSFLYWALISHFFKELKEIDFMILFLLIGFFGSIFAQFGDLTASAIKRHFNVKDYGKIIPGHGGILDRFDSVIFTSAIIYILAKILVK